MTLSMEHGGERQPEPKTEDMRPKFMEWLIRKDAEVATELILLETERPDMFATIEDQLRYTREIAGLADRRELLNEMMQEFGPPPAE